MDPILAVLEQGSMFFRLFGIILIHLQSSNRSSTASRLSLGQSLFVNVSALTSISKLSLSLAEFSQVESCDLFSLLNLLLVRLDLRLKLINESLHALMVLPVLIRGISHLLDTSLRFTKVLVSITTSAGFSINFRFQLANSGFHLVHSFFATLQSIGLSLIKAC